MWKSLAVIAILLTTQDYSPAHAKSSFLDGNMLHSYCSSVSARERSACEGYIAGYMDMLYIFHDPAKANCDFATNSSQMMDIVINYLKEHPEKRHHDGSSLVLTAMANAYPDCF